MKILLNLSLLIILLTSQSLGFEINFENIKTIDELVQIYAQKYPDQGFSEETLIRKATEEWAAQVRAEYKGVDPLDALPAQIVEADGAQYHLYGFNPGEIGSLFLFPKGHYLDFVLKAFEKEVQMGDYIFTEDGMNAVFLSDYSKLAEVRGENVRLRDYRVYHKKTYPLTASQHYYRFLREYLQLFPHSGPVSFMKSLVTLQEAIDLPRKIVSGVEFWKSLELTPQYLALATGNVDGNYYGPVELFSYHLFNKTHHTLDIETRQAFDNKLPTHLEAQRLLKRNPKAELGSSQDEYCAYIAGFLKGFAQTGNFKRVPFFIRDSHLPLVKGFLMDTSGLLQQNEFFELGLGSGGILAVEVSRLKEEGSGPFSKVPDSWKPLSKLVFKHAELYPFSVAGAVAVPSFLFHFTRAVFSYLNANNAQMLQDITWDYMQAIMYDVLLAGSAFTSKASMEIREGDEDDAIEMIIALYRAL